MTSEVGDTLVIVTITLHPLGWPANGRYRACLWWVELSRLMLRHPEAGFALSGPAKLYRTVSVQFELDEVGGASLNTTP